MLRFRYIVYLAALFGLNCTFAQSVTRILNARHITAPVVLDGLLNESDWASAEKASGFIQLAPLPGNACSQNTEVSILYDNDAIYIGAIIYDSSPDSIYKQLSARDDDGGNSDVFGVNFDTYLDHQNATSFGVTAAGVQLDGIIKFDGYNGSWNAAWYSRVTINSKGWCVEMKIPYSALRFPNKPVQEWGLNFYRSIKRYKEKAYWNKVMPEVANGVSQSGILSGIQNIKAPVRLALLPYISGYAQNYAGVNNSSLNGGMDVKYGLNESFTLDMTLVPDFGQTIFDNKVLNLSPLEVRYDERRYFFTEGLDLFNKNDLFYSRRVGGTPVNSRSPVGLGTNDSITQNPATTRLYNATKISGRTKHNLGIGFFNAVTEPEYATALDLIGKERKLQTSPLANYNVIVLDQALKNNSYISFINTNVWRKENSYNADVAALLFKFANKANRYGISGSTDVSQLYLPGKPDFGYRYALSIGKISGKYKWNLSTNTISDHFNPNDLGYLARNNIAYYIFDQYYNIYAPIGKVVNAYNHVGIEYNRVFNPSVFQSADVFGSHYITFTNYLTIGIYWTVVPFTANDYNEPRTFGRFSTMPKNIMFGGFYSSDYRRTFALDVEASNRAYDQQGRNSFSWTVSPRYRFSNKFSVIYKISGQYTSKDMGYVNNIQGSIYFGTRNVNTITNSLDAAYIFTNTMSLKLAARHYLSQPDYESYSLLGDNGSQLKTTYNTNHDINFNSFNLFTSLTWQFLPGSEMSVVYQNSIYSSGSTIIPNYLTDLTNTFQAPQTNSLSVKVIYYLDYQTMKGILKRHV